MLKYLHKTCFRVQESYTLEEEMLAAGDFSVSTS